MDHLVPTVEQDRQRMTDRLFLDDLHVGQRFASASHVVDADQIKRFAAEFGPQTFHLDETPPPTRYSPDLWPAAGTRPP